MHKAESRVVAGCIVRNSILLQIPHTEFLALEPHLLPVRLEIGSSLEKQHSRIQAAYFINRGIVSKVIEMADGRGVEVSIVGREHMTGLQLVVGLNHLMHSLVVQVPGEGFRVSVETMKWALKSLPELDSALKRRLGIQSLQFAQNAACNRLHSVRQRLARLLLLTFDRMDDPVLNTTHEFLSRMVGTDRPSISVALAKFHRLGIVSALRGSVSLVNRKKLIEQSCECYAVFKESATEIGL
jgi:CRP-like cAMP-binding protein